MSAKPKVARNSWTLCGVADMLLGFQTQLILNHKQTTLAAQHAGVARHAYNWGLAICEQAMENKQRLPTAIDLHKRLVAEVKKANPW